MFERLRDNGMLTWDDAARFVTAYVPPARRGTPLIVAPVPDRAGEIRYAQLQRPRDLDVALLEAAEKLARSRPRPVIFGLPLSLFPAMRIAGTTCFAVSCLLAAASSFAEAGSRVLPPGQTVEGESQGTWSTRWWQWASSFEYDESPVADVTGEHCGAGQSGKVWFLAGTYESHPIERTCEIPAGKYLFFPLVNYMVMPSRCDRCRVCEAVEATAKDITDEPMGLFAELDGKAIPELASHRQASPACFDLAARSRGAPKIYPTASNGYWLMLAPLAKGKHTLRIGGSLPSIRQEIVYKLDVR